ncbi:MAG: hypothetical protein J6R12_01525 [Bacteroidales bacterium]|nr:hypothetical protein [Bacteroidales bacterium]
MSKVLLLSSRIESANTSVSLDVINAIIPNATIHYVGRSIDNQLVREISENVYFYPVYSKQLELSIPSKSSSICIRLLKRICNSAYCRFVNLFVNRFRLSEERAIYQKCCELISKNEYNFIVSVSNPIYSHRVVLDLIKIKPELRTFWIPIWLDAYSNARKSNSHFKIKNCLYIEEYILSRANVIYALHETFQGNNLYKKYSNIIKHIELPYFKNNVTKTGAIKIIYAGSFVKGLRDPEPVLDILKHSIPKIINKDIIFEFYVNTPEKYKSYEVVTNGRIRFNNYVSRTVLQSILSEAYMLMNIGNKNSIQMPSKVIEYISYRKPILFFYSDLSDPSFRYYNSYPEVCFICVNDLLDVNIDKVVNYINSVHKEILYEELIRIKEFNQSTPEYLRTIIKF